MLFQQDDNTSIFLNKQFTLTERKYGAVDVSMDFRVRDTWALTFTSFRAKSFVETITAPRQLYATCGFLDTISEVSAADLKD